jgi:hypothetical protein
MPTRTAAHARIAYTEHMIMDLLRVSFVLLLLVLLAALLLPACKLCPADGQSFAPCCAYSMVPSAP